MPKELSLRTFIEDQLFQRQMSAREFARFVGVSSSTINRVLTYENGGEPTIGFLAKLATATATDLCHLVSLVAPDAPRQGDYSLAVRDIANRIAKLDERWQDFLDAVLIAIASKSGQE